MKLSETGGVFILHTKTFNDFLCSDNKLRRTGQQITNTQAFKHTGVLEGLLRFWTHFHWESSDPNSLPFSFLKWDTLASLPREKYDGHPWRHLTALPFSRSMYADFILVLIYTPDWADHTKLTYCFSHHPLSSPALGNSALHSVTWLLWYRWASRCRNTYMRLGLLSIKIRISV